MKKFSKRWVILMVAVGILVAVGLREASAQQYFFFQGKVESLYKDQLTVKGNKRETMYFAIGRRTVYIPSRLPGVGERVKATYYLQRGRNVASQVEILSAK
jgi:hypothetical protein